MCAHDRSILAERVDKLYLIAELAFGGKIDLIQRTRRNEGICDAFAVPEPCHGLRHIAAEGEFRSPAAKLLNTGKHGGFDLIKTVKADDLLGNIGGIYDIAAV